MLKTKEEIESWLKSKGVSWQNIIIHSDLTVDIEGTLNLNNAQLEEIPIRFGIIKGDLIISNNKLTRLPDVKEVMLSLNAEINHITDIENLPIIGADLNLSHNLLKSLKGLPKKIAGSLDLKNNKLVSLEYCSEIIERSFNCSVNPLKSLKFLPKEIGYDFVCWQVDCNVLKENFDNTIINRSMYFDKSHDIEKEFIAYYMKSNQIFIKISPQEWSQYQLKKSLEKSLKEQLKVNKPKI